MGNGKRFLLVSDDKNSPGPLKGKVGQCFSQQDRRNAVEPQVRRKPLLSTINQKQPTFSLSYGSNAHTGSHFPTRLKAMVRIISPK